MGTGRVSTLRTQSAGEHLVHLRKYQGSVKQEESQGLS